MTLRVSHVRIMFVVHNDADFSSGVRKGSAFYSFALTFDRFRELIAGCSSKDGYKVCSISCTFNFSWPYLVPTQDLVSALHLNQYSHLHVLIYLLLGMSNSIIEIIRHFIYHFQSRWFACINPVNLQAECHSSRNGQVGFDNHMF
jgi:hypothetical protein